jgi:hypothetical protein
MVAEWCHLHLALGAVWFLDSGTLVCKGRKEDTREAPLKKVALRLVSGWLGVVLCPLERLWQSAVKLRIG